MLLEFPGTITINGSQVIENLRLHVPNSSQFRCKFIANGDEKIPVDIICTSINYQANLNGVKVILSGMENTKRLYLMERYTLQHGEVAPGSYRDRRISLSDIVDYYMENGSEMGCFSLFLKTV